VAKVLYIGGSGEISFACVEASIKAGHQVTVFNRGHRSEALPQAVERITGDLYDDALYQQLAARNFDSVCQFIAYDSLAVLRDIDIFAGNCGQYVFISSASAYQKPWHRGTITESTPLENRFWEYSRKKAACENVLFQAHEEGRLPVTVVRPSHTYRRRLAGTCMPGDHMAWRIINDKPIVVHDAGESLWTLTHANDFAQAFAGLVGNDRALGEAFHITCESAQSWNDIVALSGKVLGHPVQTVHVSTERLIEYSALWRGPLQGDKSNSMLFDNNKVRKVVGDWRCEIGLEEGFTQAAVFTRDLLAGGYLPDQRLDALLDRIVAEQARS
jgi:nucleoside-diphosphate-sugar epimerase